MNNLTDSQTADHPLEGCDRCACGAKYYEQQKAGVWMCASCKNEIIVLFASIYDTPRDSDWIFHDTHESALAEAQAWSGEDWYNELASAVVAGETPLINGQRCWTGVMRVVVPTEMLDDVDYNAVWDASETVWSDNVTVVSEVFAPYAY